VSLIKGRWCSEDLSDLNCQAEEEPPITYFSAIQKAVVGTTPLTGTCVQVIPSPGWSGSPIKAARPGFSV